MILESLSQELTENNIPNELLDYIEYDTEPPYQETTRCRISIGNNTMIYATGHTIIIYKRPNEDSIHNTMQTYSIEEPQFPNNLIQDIKQML